MSKRNSARKKDVVPESDEDEMTSEEETEIVSLSDGDESVEEIVAPKKRRSACSYNKAAFSMPDDISKLMNRVLCTACGKQLNPMNHGAVRRHPWLKVVTCKKCYKFLKSGPFTRDSEGTDEQCRWCGDGGRLYGCDFCHNCFCRSCIKRNLGRSEAAEMENEDSKSKWKCYMCQPKKIKSLVENCTKILDYIKKEEEKEKQREERAKQREKDKALAAKEKRMSSQNGTGKSSDKKEQKPGLPIPRIKKNLDENKADRPSIKISLPAPKSKDCIVINESPDKSIKPVTAKSLMPSYNSRPGDGVTKVQQMGNGVTGVVVGPKAKMPVTMPYRDSVSGGGQISKSPSLFGMLNQAPKIPMQNANMIDRKLITQMPKVNDIRAMKEQIVPFNVETITEKMLTVAQSFSLMINSVKTDLAIAKLSSSNLYQSRNSAAFSVRTGLESFFNNIRDIFKVQVTMTSPVVNDAVIPIKIEDEPEFKTMKGILNGNTATESKNDVDIEKEDIGIKMEVQMETEEQKVADESGELLKKEVVDVKETVNTNKEGNATLEKDQDNKKEKSKIPDMKENDERKKETINMDSDRDVSSREDLANESENKSKEVISEKVDSKKDTREKNPPTKSADKSEKGSKRGNKSKSDKEDENKNPENENTAAELDLLKELADEISDSNDKDEESDEIVETRRSSRRGRSQAGNEDKKSDESQEKGSSRRKSGSQQASTKDKKDEKLKPGGESEADLEKKHSKAKDVSMNKGQEDKVPSGTNVVDDKNSDTEAGEISDTDSSSSSIVFGKRKKKRKSKVKKEKEQDNELDEVVETRRLSGRARSQKENKEKEESSKQSKNSKLSKQEKNSKKEDGTSKKEKSEKQKDYHSDSSNFEKDIKNLAKDTRPRRNKTGSNDEDRKKETEESKGEKKSVSEKSRKGSSKGKDEKKGAKKQEDDQSDSSNHDSDLEKDIKSLSKDTKLRERKTRSTTVQNKDEGTKTEKSTKAKKVKKDVTTEDSSDSDDSEDEETEAHSPEADEIEDNGVEEEEEEEEEDQDEDDLSPSQIRKLKAAQKKTEEDSDYEDMAASENSDSEDPEVSFPKLETPKKGEKKKAKDEDSDDSDFVTPKKKKTKLKSELLDAKLSGSDSDVGPKKKKKGRGRKRKKEEEEDEEPDPEDEIYSDDDKKKKGKGKRKRIKKVASSSDEEGEKKEDEGGEEDVEDTPGGAHKRRKIRRVMANKKLADSTKEARKAEDERRKRIEERQKEFNAYVEVEGGESEDEIPEGTEREKKEKDEDSISQILGSPRKVPITTKCVLDMEKESKKVLIEIDKTLVRKLKPHQVEAVRFMYNCCVESIDRLRKEEGAGCILAHCMGLGKTLSVITFLHTMLSNVKLTKMTKCLVVCPLNTVLNWVNEFEIWLDDVDYEIVIYEMSKVKQNYERAQMLREWHEGKAGVMILGYDMYRNLVMGSHCKNKKQKATFYETLADPGPDIVVCDEGHILKNDSTSLSKAMSKIVSKRRVVLTGTPLQNNLNEYHCMVNFVKPNLLGTRKEFSNRFVNPITNGQCTDSSATDVKLMKRRAHILHEMLAGCVQRKDYSALTKFLPPKLEYVISVRMGKLQCTLYENYLKEVGVVMNEEIQGKGGRLFRDYQALMRIWTHPWVLKLDEIRQENKKTYDSEDSFIDDEESDEDSFISASTTSESEDSDGDMKKKKSKGKGKKKRKGSGSSSDDGKDGNDDNEVVKKWTSKRRGNEEGAGSSWMVDMGYSTGPKEVSSEWWAEYVKEEDEFKIELSGKITLLFEILKMCEDIGDKVLVFSQSLLSLDIIEDFLHHVDESSNKEGQDDPAKKSEEDTKEDKKDKKDEDDKKEDGKEDEKDDKKKDKYAEYGKSWTLGADYFRMDGSTNSQQRKAAQDSFNDPDNFRARLFLISTKAGSLGINLVAANRVIIFDASWNPSHDIQSIFRVYRFGQVKPVYVYRFLAQGTMEEKIYERQVTKQSLSQRVVDEHQIERHFTSNDLQELYKFQPDRLDDPDRKDIPLPMLPKDHMLAELMSTQKDWIVTFHEHDSLLENIVEQELTEDEKKAAWEDYENEKKGLNTAFPMYGNMMMNPAQRMNTALEFQNLVLQGQASLGQEAVIQIVQDLKTRFPHLPPEVFSQRVQAVLRQVLTQRIMHQSDLQRRQLDQQKMAELNRLNQIKQQIQQQQALINSQQRGMGLQGYPSNSLYGVQALPSSGYFNSVMPRPGAMNYPTPPPAHSSSKTQQKSSSKGDK